MTMTTTTMSTALTLMITCGNHFFITHSCQVHQNKPLIPTPRVFPGRTGGPPSSKNFVNPPAYTCPCFWTKACPPPPAEVRPQKFEKSKYIFVSNLTTFKLKSILKSCISCLNSKKRHNFALSGQFQSPHQKFREKALPPFLVNLFMILLHG